MAKVAECNLLIHGISVGASDPSIQTHHVPLKVVKKFLAEARHQYRGDWLRPDLWPCALVMIEFFPRDPYLTFVTASFPSADDVGRAVRFRLSGVLYEVGGVSRIGEVSFSTPESAALLLGTEAWEGGLMLQVSKAEDGTGVRAELSWRRELEKRGEVLIAGLNLNLQAEATARIGEMVFKENDMLLASFLWKAVTDEMGIATAIIYFAAGNSGLLDFVG